MEFGEEFRMIKEGLRMGVEGVEEGRGWEYGRVKVFREGVKRRIKDASREGLR